MKSFSGLGKLDNLQLSYPKAILFDWDNTIVDSMHCIHTALANTFSYMGRDFVEYDKDYSLCRRDMFPKYFGKDCKLAEQIFRKELCKFSTDAISLFNGVEDVLKYIANSSEIFLGIVSNKLSNILHSELEHFGLKHYFKNVVGSGDAIRDKPYSDPVELVLENSGILLSSDVWLVGDSITDIECAINSNITPILYKSNYDDRIIDKQYFKIDSHEEIISILENLKHKESDKGIVNTRDNK